MCLFVQNKHPVCGHILLKGHFAAAMQKGRARGGGIRHGGIRHGGICRTRGDAGRGGGGRVVASDTTSHGGLRDQKVKNAVVLAAVRKVARNELKASLEDDRIRPV